MKARRLTSPLASAPTLNVRMVRRGRPDAVAAGGRPQAHVAEGPHAAPDLALGARRRHREAQRVQHCARSRQARTRLHHLAPSGRLRVGTTCARGRWGGGARARPRPHAGGSARERRSSIMPDNIVTNTIVPVVGVRPTSGSVCIQLFCQRGPRRPRPDTAQAGRTRAASQAPGRLHPRPDVRSPAALGFDEARVLPFISRRAPDAPELHAQEDASPSPCLRRPFETRCVRGRPISLGCEAAAASCPLPACALCMSHALSRTARSHAARAPCTSYAFATGALRMTYRCGRTQELNPLPFVFIAANCISWVTYSFLIDNWCAFCTAYLTACPPA